MSDSPFLHALLTCDQVIMDANRGKWSAISIFSEIASPSFPATHPSMDVLAIVGDMPKAGTITVSMNSPGGVAIATESKPFEVPDQTKAVELGVPFRMLALALPGRYSVSVHVNDQLVGERAVWVRKV